MLCEAIKIIITMSTLTDQGPMMAVQKTQKKLNGSKNRFWKAREKRWHWKCFLKKRDNKPLTLPEKKWKEKQNQSQKICQRKSCKSALNKYKCKREFSSPALHKFPKCRYKCHRPKRVLGSIIHWSFSPFFGDPILMWALNFCLGVLHQMKGLFDLMWVRVCGTYLYLYAYVCDACILVYVPFFCFLDLFSVPF